MELGGVARARHEPLGGGFLDVVGVARLRVDREAALGEAGQGAGQVARDARDQARPHQDRVDVPVGVVVGEDRLARVLRVAGGVEVAGGGEDRVDRVVGVLDAVLVGVDAVGAPGRGDELHPAERAGVGDVQVAAVVGLDLVDRRQDLPADAVLGAGRLVDRQQEDRDAELLDDEVRHRGGGRGAGEEAGALARAGGLGQGRVRAGGGAVGVAELRDVALPFTAAATTTIIPTSRVVVFPAAATTAATAAAATGVGVDVRDPTAATTAVVGHGRRSRLGGRFLRGWGGSRRRRGCATATTATGKDSATATATAAARWGRRGRKRTVTGKFELAGGLAERLRNVVADTAELSGGRQARGHGGGDEQRRGKDDVEKPLAQIVSPSPPRLHRSGWREKLSNSSWPDASSDRRQKPPPDPWSATAAWPIGSPRPRARVNKPSGCKPSRLRG